MEAVCRAWKRSRVGLPGVWRNVSRVAAGTGEAFPGPVACGFVLPERGVL